MVWCVEIRRGEGRVAFRFAGRLVGQRVGRRKSVSLRAVGQGRSEAVWKG